MPTVEVQCPKCGEFRLIDLAFSDIYFCCVCAHTWPKHARPQNPA